MKIGQLIVVGLYLLLAFGLVVAGATSVRRHRGWGIAGIAVGASLLLVAFGSFVWLVGWGLRA